ncbi:hypothetical protein ACFC96_36250 [Streptomyces sp. NPDC055955]|uniref:hypothetical protein n=1 Tax=Streptomyces sp. NPDC055955 TaxID=3345665 RepID=UPI0035DECC0E
MPARIEPRARDRLDDISEGNTGPAIEETSAPVTGRATDPEPAPRERNRPRPSLADARRSPTPS